VLRTT